MRLTGSGRIVSGLKVREKVTKGMLKSELLEKLSRHCKQKQNLNIKENNWNYQKVTNNFVPVQDICLSSFYCSK